MDATEVTLYLLALIIVSGIGFLVWTLIHLVIESHRPVSPAAQGVDLVPWRR